MTTTLFRSIILFSVLAGLVGGSVDSFCPSLLPESLSAAWEEQPSPNFLTEYLWVTIALLGPWLVASIASTIGLFFFRHWARPLALAATAVGLPVSVLVGPTVASGWSTALLELSFVTWGAVLALAYSSPVGERFVRTVAPGVR